MNKINVLVFVLSIFSFYSCKNDRNEKIPPNIILVLVDDCSADELSCYGNTKYATPVLDQLAVDGARFETCWATPLCSPSRALIMTGRYGFRTGWYANSMKKNIPLPDENQIFAQVLKDAGYRTAVAGKWQLPGLPPEYGFENWSLWAYKSMLPEGIKHPGVETLDSTKYNYKKPARFWYPSVIQNGSYLPTTADDYGPDVHTDFLIDFMLQESEQPFLVYYPMVLTHDPFFPTPLTIKSPEEKFGASKQERNFKSNVEYMDYCIGRILASLEEQGLSENTAVIFTADNGTLRRGKGAAKEIGVREPLIVHWPGHVEKQGVKRELIDFSDIFPTLLDIADVEIPEGYVFDGYSFLPLLENEAYEEREYIFSYLDIRRLVRDKRWLLEGDGRFFDCGESRNPRGYKEYKDVTDSDDPEVKAAMERFATFLVDKPSPLPKH